MNIYKEVRRRYLNGESQRGIAQSLGISRNTVKKYCEGATVPWERKSYSRKPVILTEDVKAFIARCLREDKVEGTSKQRHTAKRIFNRLVDEKGFTGSESTVRAYVHLLNEKSKEAFVPLVFDAGDAVQIDWGEATIYLTGQKMTINLFCARLCFSEAPFVIAYRRQNSESFLDAIVQTLAYYGGTPRRIIFDNAKVAVKDGFGANAKATDSYAKLAAHYGFEPTFCNVASGNEKGLVEGLVGFSRRNFCVPVPRVETMEELNQNLREQCQKYMAHTVPGRGGSVGVLFSSERTSLYPLPAYRYDPAKRSEVKVGPYSTVRYDTNNYSVPVQYCGKPVTVKALPERIEVFSGGEMIAVHQRCFDHNKSVYSLEHYLPLLEQKGRAIFQARPVRDNVPEFFLNWLKKQNLRPKELVSILKLSLEIGYEAAMHAHPTVDVKAISDPIIRDPVQVADVNLAAYDVLSVARTEVST